MAGVEALLSQAAAACERGDLSSGQQLFSEIVAHYPDAHPAWNALSMIAVRNSAPEAAVEYALRATQIERRNPAYLNNLGIAYAELGRFDDADKAFRQALRLHPAYLDALFNLGRSLHKQAKLADSLRAFERAYAIDPRFPHLALNLAHLYLVSGNPRRGMEVASVLKERDATAAILFASCAGELQGGDAAIDAVRRLAEEHPDPAPLRTFLGSRLLAEEAWRDGWENQAWRSADLAGRQPGAVQSLPQSLDGKRVLLREEQGIGDNLFFLRFAAQLRARGARVSLQCSPRFGKLLSESQVVDDVIIGERGPTAAYDLSLWVGDLPAALRAEACPPPIELRVPAGNSEKARDALRAWGTPPYLGVTWRAGVDLQRGSEFAGSKDVLCKQIGIQEIGQALKGWRGTVVSLQRDPYPGEIDALSAELGAAVPDLSPHSEDLRELLALLSVLDEYVGVSNTNMHLRASIGAGARVLVTYPPEWRWTRKGATSPWFPGFHLYRQQRFFGGWDDALDRLRSDLIQ